MVTNKEPYLNLRQALDSLVDIAQLEFRLIEMDNKDNVERSKLETNNYAEFVVERVRRFLAENAARQQDVWARLSPEIAAIYTEHAASLAAHPGCCPPGYRQEGNDCVKILDETTTFQIK